MFYKYVLYFFRTDAELSNVFLFLPNDNSEKGLSLFLIAALVSVSITMWAQVEFFGRKKSIEMITLLKQGANKPALNEFKVVDLAVS